MTNSADAKTPAADVTILNVALGLELEAIAAYKAGAGSKLLSGAALDMAGNFSGTTSVIAICSSPGFIVWAARPYRRRAPTISAPSLRLPTSSISHTVSSRVLRMPIWPMPAI